MPAKISVHDLWPNESREYVLEMMKEQSTVAAGPAQRSVDLMADRYRREARKRRATKISGTGLPEPIAARMDDSTSSSFQALGKLEERIDSLITRRTLSNNERQDQQDQQDQIAGPIRIWIWSEVASTQEDSAVPNISEAIDVSKERSKFVLHVEGRALSGETAVGLDSASNVQGRFSDVFERVHIRRADGHADPSPRSILAEWQADRSPHGQPHDGISLSGSSIGEISVIVELFPRWSPRYQVHSLLGSIIGIEEGSEQDILNSLWQYVNASHLHDETDRRNIRFDERLRVIFKAEELPISVVQAHVQQLITPLPSVMLPYTVQAHSSIEPYPWQQNTVAFDVRVPMSPLMVGNEIQSHDLAPDSLTSSELMSLDDQKHLLMQAIVQSEQKLQLLERIAASPVDQMSKWMRSQQGDLRLIFGEETRGISAPNGLSDSSDRLGSEWRRGGERSLWASNGVQEGVRNWLIAEGSVTRRMKR